MITFIAELLAKALIKLLKAFHLIKVVKK